MPLHYISIRCDQCQRLFNVRRPKEPNLIPSIVEKVKCPTCYPEALVGVCGACRLPLAVVRPPKKWGKQTATGRPSGYHKDLCFPCYARYHRLRSVTSSG